MEIYMVLSQKAIKMRKLYGIYAMRKVWCENCSDDDNGKGYLESELKEYFGMHVCNVCAENFERGRG